MPWLPTHSADQVRRTRWVILVVLAVSLAVISIDNTILNVALPTIQKKLGASNTELQWIVDAYTIVFSGLLLVMGSLSDRFGRRGTLLAGLVAFATFSGLSAWSGSSSLLIAYRAVMGIGGAAIMPTTLSILVATFADSRERARAIGIWTAVSATGIALGPLAGGFLVEHFWWGSVFLVNVPICAVAVAACVAWVPTSSDPGAPRVDVPGALLSVAAIVLVLFAVIQAPDEGWANPGIYGTFVAGLAVGAGFVLLERRRHEPMLETSLFRNPQFSSANMSMVLVFLALMGTMFLSTQYLQNVLGYGALQAGAASLPVSVALVVFSPLSARVDARFGTRATVAVGFVVVAGGLLMAAAWGLSTPYLFMAVTYVVIGVGLATAMTPATNAIMNAVPREKAGIGSAMNDVTRELGGAVGVAILGSVLASKYGGQLGVDIARYAEGTHTSVPQQAIIAIESSVGSALGIARNVGGDTGRRLAAAAKSAFVDGQSEAMVIAAIAALAGAVVAWRWLPRVSRDPGGDHV